MERQFKVSSMQINNFAKIIKLKKKKAWNEDGVASTIGTIMALLVFLTFLGMFTNQYIPAWMEENENNHMNGIIQQFSFLKWGIDSLILNSDEGEVASAPIYTPMQLHAEGVPIFASATVGRLSFVSENPSYPWFSVSFPTDEDAPAGESGNFVFNDTNGGKTGGSLEFYGANRYYVQQTLAYENGAIILNQTDGESMLSGMAIRIVKYGDEQIVKITQISLTGTNRTIGGYGTKGVTSTLEYSTYSKFENSSGGNLTISINSRFGTAWEDYFTNLLSANSTGLTTSEWNVTTSSSQVGDITYYSVTVIIQGVNVFEHTKAMVAITIADISV